MPEKIKVTQAQVAAISRLVSSEIVGNRDELMKLHAIDPEVAWSSSSGLQVADLKTMAALLWFPELLEIGQPEPEREATIAELLSRELKTLVAEKDKLEHSTDAWLIKEHAIQRIEWAADILGIALEGDELA